MKRNHDVARLDIEAFIREGQGLSGELEAQALPRWAASQQPPQDTALPPVEWSAQGETRDLAGAAVAQRLHLRARGLAWMTCQRCLQPMQEAVAVDNRLRFVRGEAQAEALDAEVDEDVLAFQRAFDLRGLIEDELLLALPLVPRHAVCPQPLPLPEDDAVPAAADTAAHPFAALQALKRAPGGT